MQGEPVEQDKEREYFTLTMTVSVSRGNPPSSRCRTD
jgi:hypothetical protein